MSILTARNKRFTVQEISHYSGYAETTIKRITSEYKNGTLEFKPIGEHACYFIVESPNVETSNGVCLFCFKRKVHYNSEDAYIKVKKSHSILSNPTSGGRGITIGKARTVRKEPPKQVNPHVLFN